MEKLRVVPRSPALERAELLLAHFLRWGVLTSAGIILLGLISSWFVNTHGFSRSDIQTLTNGGNLTAPESPFSLHDPLGIITVGLLVLIALPIVRVGITVVLFFLEKDYFYFFITSLVFAVLIAGILFGKII